MSKGSDRRDLSSSRERLDSEFTGCTEYLCGCMDQCGREGLRAGQICKRTEWLRDGRVRRNSKEGLAVEALDHGRFACHATDAPKLGGGCEQSSSLTTR